MTNTKYDGWGAGSYIRGGLVALLVLGGGFGGWAATADLAGAVIATGQLRVETNRQVVQHPDGGVVGEILVREGDTVDAGDVLIRLDDSILRSELIVLENQLYELMARRGRLQAEQSGDDEIVFDPELLERAEGLPDVASLIEGQVSLFSARRESTARESEVMGERKVQLDEQIKGVDAELESLERQSELIEEELEGQRKLLEQGLAQAARVLSLEREAARLLGQRGQLTAQAARLRGQISEIDIEVLRLEAGVREEAITESRELGFRELDLKEQRIALLARLDRLDIRAPRGGVVLDMTVHALKSVIRPAEPVLYVVPNDTEMVVDAQVEPIHIDQLYAGQEAVLRFSAFNARTTPEVFASVNRISADAILNETTGASFYKAELRLNSGELEKLEGQELVAGMPVEVYIQTGERTPLNYMVKPITDYFNRAMREE